MKTLFQSRTRATLWIMLTTLSLLCFCSAIMIGNRQTGQQGVAGVATTSTASQRSDLESRSENGEREELESRSEDGKREDLERLLGMGAGTVSPEEFAEARTRVHTLVPNLFGESSWPSFAPTPGPPLVDPFWNLNGENSVRTVALGLHPSDPNVIYAGSYGGLLKSTDGGMTWRTSFDSGLTWRTFLSDGWESQAVSAIAIDPHTPGNNLPNTVYVSTGSIDLPRGYGFGIYRSTDEGDTWTRFAGDCPTCPAPGPAPSPTDAVFEGAAITSVVVDPHNSGDPAHTTIYAATNHFNNLGGLFRSDDGGEHWTLVFSDSCPTPSPTPTCNPATTGPWRDGIWSLALDPLTTPSTLYVADKSGVWKGTGSTCGSWQLIYPATCKWITNYWKIKLSVVDPGGGSAHSLPYLLSRTADDHNRLYFSANADQNWTEIQTLFGGNPMEPEIFVVDPSNRHTILAGIVEFCRTQLAGYPTPMPSASPIPATWENVRGQTPWPCRLDFHVDQRAVAFSQATPGLVVIGNDGGIWKSTQSGAKNTWQNLNHNLPGALLYRAALSSDGSMIAGTLDNGVLVSPLAVPPVSPPSCTPTPPTAPPADDLWKFIEGGDGFSTLINPDDSSLSYYTFNGDGARPFRRYNKFTNDRTEVSPIVNRGYPEQWQSCDGYGPSVWNMNPLFPTHITVACGHAITPQAPGTGLIFRTWDASATPVVWSSIEAPTSKPFYTVHEAPSSPNVIYAITNNQNDFEHKVWVTTDADDPAAPPSATPTWTNITPGDLSTSDPINNVAIDPSNPAIAYLSCDKAIYKTENYGGSWTILDTGLVYHDAVIDPAAPDHVFTASNDGVYHSGNGGQNWERLDSIPHGLVVTSLSLNDTSRQLAASTWGRGTYILNLPYEVRIPPTASITFPANNSFVGGSVIIRARVQDYGSAVSGVRFRVDDTDLDPLDTAAPYSVSWPSTKVENGSQHTLTAQAYDADFNIMVSAPVDVTVDNEPPAVSISAPAPSATVSHTVNIEANADDSMPGSGVAAVQFKLDNTLNLGWISTSPYSLSWNSKSTTNGTHSLTAVACDRAGNCTPASINVTVDNTNHPPVGTDTIVTTPEDSPYVFTVANFGFSDPNDAPPDNFSAVKITTLPAAGTLKLSCNSVTVGQFIAASAITAGSLVFTSAPNANGAGYTSFTFQVQDDAGTGNGGTDLDPTPNTMTINVTAVNDPPAGTDTTVTTLEDTPYAFTVANFGFSDPIDVPPNNLSAVKITTLPAAGTLKLGINSVTVGQFIAASAITAGSLVFTPAANANGAGYTSFTFQVQDDGGTAKGVTNLDPTPNTATINVTPVNDPPAGTDTTVTTLEDTLYTFTLANFGFSDPSDTPANNLSAVKITTLPAAGTLKLSGTSVTAGQFIAASAITAGNLVFTPAANANGTGYTSFTFQVQDDGGTANGGADLDATPNTMTINVTAVNDPPAGTDTPVTTLEDTAYTFTTADFGFSDPNDTPPNILNGVIITTLPGAGTLALAGTPVTAGQLIPGVAIFVHTLVFTPATNASGSPYTSFTFQVKDNGGTANGGVSVDPSPNTMTINVTPVNDPPAGTDTTVTTSQNTAYTFAIADFGFSDPNDTPPNILNAVIITTLPGAGTLALAGTPVTAGQSIPGVAIFVHTLVFTPATNATGSPYTSFTFQVKDNGGTANGGVSVDPSPNTMTINVTP